MAVPAVQQGVQEVGRALLMVMEMMIRQLKRHQRVSEQQWYGVNAAADG